jgi:hypothetical protein
MLHEPTPLSIGSCRKPSGDRAFNPLASLSARTAAATAASSASTSPASTAACARSLRNVRSVCGFSANENAASAVTVTALYSVSSCSLITLRCAAVSCASEMRVDAFGALVNGDGSNDVSPESVVVFVVVVAAVFKRGTGAVAFAVGVSHHGSKRSVSLRAAAAHSICSVILHKEMK